MAGWNALYFHEGDFPVESAEVGRMEPRRVSRRRSWPLRRVPHAEELRSARRRRGKALQRRRTASTGMRPSLGGDLARRPRRVVRSTEIVEYLKTGANAKSRRRSGRWPKSCTNSTQYLDRRGPARDRGLPQGSAAARIDDESAGDERRQWCEGRCRPACARARHLHRQLRRLPHGKRRRHRRRVSAAQGQQRRAGERPGNGRPHHPERGDDRRDDGKIRPGSRCRRSTGSSTTARSPTS